MIVALSAGRESPTDLRARLTLDEAAHEAALQAPPEGIAELVLLFTCHRVEAYALSSDTPSHALHALAGIFPLLRPSDDQDLQVFEGLEAAEHLFRVACGLDSLVVGEPQVLSQVRRALRLAKKHGAAGPTLSRLFDRATALGRRVRAETEIGDLAGSLGSLAASYLAERLDGLHGRPGTVIGAGEGARDAAQSLVAAGAQLSVVSRRYESAERLAAEVGAVPLKFEELAPTLDRSEFALAAISGGVAVRAADLPTRARPKPFVVLDLSTPPAVEVDGRSDVEVRTIEDLTVTHSQAMKASIARAEGFVAKEVSALERWLGGRGSAPAIRRLRERTESLVADELARAVAGLDLTPEEQERIAAMGMRIANKLLHGPTTLLRDSDDEIRRAIERAFGLDS